MAEQMGERPVEARRDGGRDIDEPPVAIGFPEPAAPRAFEIAHQIERALLVADREARRARRAPLMPDVFAHHHDEQAQKHETGESGRAPCRERVCKYVYLSGVAVSQKKKTKANRKQILTAY